MDTKLAVRVSPELCKQAHAVAELRGETVSDVVRAALAQYIQDALEEAQDARELDALEQRIDAGLEPLYDHDEVMHHFA